jgi:hypothetical protein
MLIEGLFPFIGEVTWLTPEEGGRRGGVPPVVDGLSYAHAAHVPPRSVGDGSASFVLRGWDPAQWRSPAEGRWLLVENEGDHLVEPGTVVIITEGPRPVASFRVDEVLPIPPA